MPEDKRSLDEKIDEILKRLGVLEIKVSGLENGFGEMKKEVSELKSEVSGLKNEVSELKGKISEMDSTLKSLNNRVTNLEISYNSIAAGVAAGEETRKRVIDYRALSISSPAGFNARGRVKGRGY